MNNGYSEFCEMYEAIAAHCLKENYFNFKIEFSRV